MRERQDYESLQNPDLSFVAFDLETTGLSPQLDRIVEIGAVKFVDGKETARWGQLINPEMAMPPGAAAVNGITDDMLKGQPTVRESLPEFLKFIGNAVLVAHNAAFDLGFVRSAMGRLGLGMLANDFVDTRVMAQRAFPGRPNYKLQSLAVDLGIEALEAHRAVDDARVCLGVFQACLKELNPGGQGSFF
jgi:DNA polymerase-3 subunit epsilon